MNYRDENALRTLVTDDFSEWSEPLKITQQMIDNFADLTGDRLWIHVDPDRCAEQSPFGSTIAHGFLILSLLPSMPCGEDVTKTIEGYRQVMNYGSNQLRFLNPVPVDSDIHARNRVANVSVEERKTVVTIETEVAVVGAGKPSLVYQLLLVLM